MNGETNPATPAVDAYPFLHLAQRTGAPYRDVLMLSEVFTRAQGVFAPHLVEDALQALGPAYQKTYWAAGRELKVQVAEACCRELARRGVRPVPEAPGPV